MNRSFISVIAGGFGTESTSSSSESTQDQGEVIAIDSNELSDMLLTAKKVMIIPGYGMAVSQAQHTVNEIVKVLKEKKIEVSFAIHPVAGRMPGHMNVLLAEAKVPYDVVFEMDEVNDDFQLICFDFVSEPSTPGAFMLREAKESDLNNFTQEDKLNRLLNDILY